MSHQSAGASTLAPGHLGPMEFVPLTGHIAWGSILAVEAEQGLFNT